MLIIRVPHDGFFPRANIILKFPWEMFLFQKPLYTLDE